MTRIVQRRGGLLKKEKIKVEAIGDLVVMHFGNTEVSIKYESALAFAQMVRVQAKVAKRRAGDLSRHWSTVGLLSDAEQIASGRF